MIHLPDPDLRPPEPTGCVDCGSALDDGECPACEEETAERKERARLARRRLPSLCAQDADDANDRAREARDERKREGL